MQGGAKLTLVCFFWWQETTHHVVCAQVSRISPELLTAIDKGFFSMAEPLGQARNKASAREHAATWETERTKYHYDHWDAFEVLYTQFCVHLSARLNGDENFESEDEDEEAGSPSAHGQEERPDAGAVLEQQCALKAGIDVPCSRCGQHAQVLYWEGRLHMCCDHVCMVCRRVDGTICCGNMFQPDFCRVAPSTLLPAQNGLYATRDIPPGVWIASFGKCKTVAGPHVQTEYGYTFPCRGTEVGGSCVQWVTPVAILQKDELAHAINHTCDEDKVDVELVNTSGDFEYNEEKGKWIEIEPIIVYVRSKRHVPSGNEIFGTYAMHESVQCVCHRCKRESLE